MPLNNFDFPGVTFNQVFDSAAVLPTSTLSVLCVGTQYSLHKAGTKDAVQVPGDEDYDPSEGLTATITSSIGATIDPLAASHHLVVKDGAFLYYNDTDIAEATDLTNRSIVFTKAVKDGGGYEADENFGSRGARVGDTVILTGTGSSTPIVTTILKISPVANVGFAKIIVGNTGSLTALTSVGFCATLDATYEEGANTFTYSDGTLNIEGGLKAVIDDISAETEGTLQSGTFYFEYREALTKYVGKLGVVASFNDLYEQLGPWCADNPLSLACYFALAGGRAVYYTGVSEATGDAYTTALDSLSKYTELYSIVPATEDTAIIEACMAYCESVSNDEDNVVRRALWYGVTADEEIKLWSGTATISTADNTTTVTVSENSDDVYLDTNLQAGDVIAKAGDTSARWTISAVNGPKSLTLASGTGAPATAQNYVILRTQPTVADIVDNIVAKRCTQSERAMCVWADGLQFGGEDLPNYPLAAAAAGMRAAEYCHRPISNLGYSFFSLANTNAFTRDQLKLIGRNGIWIIANYQDGTPINMRQLTTAIANDVNRDEESVIANVDTIAMGVSRVGGDKTGNSNISPALLDALENDVTLHMDNYKLNESGSVYIGPQLLDWELERIWQDPVNLDHVYASLWCQPPKPFNKFHITVRII